MSEFEASLNAILSNPDAMGQILSLAQSLGQGGQKEDAPSEETSASETESGPGTPETGEVLPGFPLDPSMLRLASGVMGELQKGGSDKNMTLLSALRPFLKESRQSKIDQAVQMAQLSRVAKAAFRMMKGGGDTV